MEHYDKAIAIFTECRSDKKKLKAIRHKGRLLLKEGRITEALELYDKAVTEADKVESDYESAKCWFERYRALLAAVRREPL